MVIAELAKIEDHANRHLVQTVDPGDPSVAAWAVMVLGSDPSRFGDLLSPAGKPPFSTEKNRLSAVSKVTAIAFQIASN